MEKPLRRRMFVFAVRERSRMRTKSGLYVPDSNRGMLTRAEDVWVLSAASDCRYNWTKGQHLLISDGFELEPVDLDLWEKYSDDKDFEFIKTFSQEVDGKVRTCVVHEESILAEIDGNLVQEDTMW